MPWLKPSEWGRQHGWSVQYANRRVKECGIPRNGRNLIDSAVADAMHAGEAAPAAVVSVVPAATCATVADAGVTEWDGLPKSDLERLEIIENLRKKRLANDENEGQLLRREDVRKAWEGHRDAVKNRLMLLEAKVPADSRFIVGREVRSALNELAEYQVSVQ